MTNYRKQYLDHLERWLNYEEESSAPPIVEEGKTPPRKEPLPPKPRKRVDSLGFIDEARCDIAREVTKKNLLGGAARSKCVADQGKVSRMPIVLPLPSCARQEASEERAASEATLGFIEVQNQGKTVKQKIRSLLGL